MNTKSFFVKTFSCLLFYLILANSAYAQRPCSNNLPCPPDCPKYWIENELPCPIDAIATASEMTCCDPTIPQHTHWPPSTVTGVQGVLLGSCTSGDCGTFCIDGIEIGGIQINIITPGTVWPPYLQGEFPVSPDCNCPTGLAELVFLGNIASGIYTGTPHYKIRCKQP